MKRIFQLAIVAIVIVGVDVWPEEVPLNSIYATAKEGGHVVGLRYPDPKSVDFLKRVLEMMGSPFATKHESDSVTVYWVPASTEQEQEVQNRVSQFDFIREVCPNLRIPSPSDPAKAEMKCAK